MVEIVWTQEAVTWLEKIHKYIAKDNPIAAQKVVQGIYAKAQYTIWIIARFLNRDLLYLIIKIIEEIK